MLNKNAAVATTYEIIDERARAKELVEEYAAAI